MGSLSSPSCAHHHRDQKDQHNGTVLHTELRLPAIYLNTGKPYTTVTLVRNDGLRRELLVPRAYSTSYVWANMIFTVGIGNVLDAASRKHYRYPYLPVSDAFAQAEERVMLAPYWQGLGNVVQNERRLSRIAALGSAWRPAAKRKSARRSCTMSSKVPALIQRWVCWCTVCQGGKSFGIIRHGMPPRTR